MIGSYRKKIGGENDMGVKKLSLITLALILSLSIGSVAAANTGDYSCKYHHHHHFWWNDNQNCDQNSCDDTCCNETNCTDNSTNSTDNGTNAAAGGKLTTTYDPSVNASASTIPLQKTGIPVAPLALAAVSVFAGFIAPKIRRK